jgi:hypothetical protein
MGRVRSRWHRRQEEEEEWSERKRTNGEVQGDGNEKWENVRTVDEI